MNATNTFNPANLTLEFASPTTLALTPASKTALLAAWKHAAIPSFPACAPPIPAPAGPRAFAVGRDAAGRVRRWRRSSGGDLPGARL